MVLGLGGRLGEVLVRDGAPDLPDVLLVLEDDAERLVDHVRRQLRGAEAEQRGCPVERLGDPGTFVRSAARSRWTNPTTSRASRGGASGTRVATISNSFDAVG